MNDISYFIYCRKSSESEDRQAASIQDQINAIQKIVDAQKLNVIEVFTEEKSSKDPGRPVFNEMLARIHAGDADGILCWDNDRLSRNPIDGGNIAWMLQKSVLKIIKTPSRSYYPEDAGLLLSIEQGRATDYVIRLSKNVKRGLNGKAQRGWRPTGSPIGYINVGIEKGSKTIDIDPDRFDLVRRMWDLYLTGQYSVRELHNIVNDKWGLTTPKHRSIGGKPLSMSHLYRILNDTFYYGEFSWIDPETCEASMYKGKHRPMITRQEFERAQILLGAKGKPQPQVREFAYTGLVTCGECTSAITAEVKKQAICTDCRNKFSNLNRSSCPKCSTEIEDMKNPTLLNYTYYRCSKKKGPCSQKYLGLEKFEEQFSELLDKMTIDQRYIQVAIDYLRDTQNVEISDHKKITASLRNAHRQTEERIERLNKEYTSSLNEDYSLYTPDEFKQYKKELRQDRDRIKREIEIADLRADESFDMTERTFNFCALAKKCFNEGDLKMKRLLLNTIGSNMTLMDKKLNVQAIYPFQLIINELQSQAVLKTPLEHEKAPVKQGLSQDLGPKDPRIVSLLRMLNEVRTCLVEN